MELKAQTAIVTGGSRGIGRAIALELARTGAMVVVNYRRDEEAAAATAAAITAEGGKAITIGADVSDSSQATRLVEEAVEATGRLDILVNNAGITRD
ncbi:MAG: SDR family NAD(P)-dependent oxidoreductase, partial [Sphingomicrobium sp.]